MFYVMFFNVDRFKHFYFRFGVLKSAFDFSVGFFDTVKQKESANFRPNSWIFCTIYVLLTLAENNSKICTTNPG